MAEFTEEACSHCSQLGEEDLQKLKEEYRKIRKSKRCGINKNKNWCQRRRIVCDLAVVDATELSVILRRFYAEVETTRDKKISHQVP